MRRLGRWKLGFIALLPVLIYFGFKIVFDGQVEDASEAHVKARAAFLAELPDTDCLKVGDIMPVVRNRGWAVRPDPDFNWCVKPDSIQSWLRVTIQPGLPFSTDDENAEMFGFDAEGCAVDWTYGSGPGSTCPN